MKRLLIIANRLPVNVKKTSSGIQYSKSAGGLATGLDSLTVDYEKHWIGWPGISPKDNEVKEQITEKLAKDNIHPVYLSQKELEYYYEGFSNKTIWPLFHYFPLYTIINNEYYQYYENVNKIFAEKVLEIAKDDDIIWVQDYHLMLLPAMIRKKLPNSEIGFFLHIPFPSYELFRMLPWRKELLEGLMGADLIGFHTYEYMRHFVSAIYRIIGVEPHLGSFYYNNRTVQVDTFPMGINYEKFNSAPDEPHIKREIKSFKERFGNLKLILSIDRLDYSKGIINRLKAFDKFLEKNKKYRGKVTLVMVLVPSRSSVDQYQSLKVEIDEAVGNINGKYALLKWTPIQYFYRTIPFEQLVALYHLADIGLVTPLRDGMNLVAKEFIATKSHGKGVLILSEMAGAAIELVGAHIINPYDVDDIAKSIESVMEMPENEQMHRIRTMQNRISKQTVQKWANDFIRNLDNISLRQKKLEQKTITKSDFLAIKEDYSIADNRLLLLDYDGTLIAYSDNPKDVEPDEKLLNLLQELTADPHNKVVVLSGRDHKTLNKWFAETGVDMISDHGTWYYENGKWKEIETLSDEWKLEIRELMQQFVDRTPGSFIEEKPYSVVWHYRKTDAWLSDIRAKELINSLIYPSSRLNLEILDGNKIIEVKVTGVDKGTTAKNWIDKKQWDFIMAVGDDRTDEDLFRTLPENALSIKIGIRTSDAKFNIASWREVRKLLQFLSETDATAAHSEYSSKAAE